jgi:nucleotide-binding universal stress UspA family protein
MKTIIAPTDFTPGSLAAVNYAADMACVIGANVYLLHVCQVAVVVSEIPVSDYLLVNQLETAEDRMGSLERTIRSRVGERVKITGKVEQGDVVAEIKKHCEALDTYAVVMGAETASTFERVLVGGRTISAVRNLRWPVIVVPAGVQFSSINKVGLACDYKDVVETIPAQEIKHLVKDLHAQLHILYINRNTETELSAEMIEESAWLQEMFSDLEPEYHYITKDNVENSIIEFADKNHLDLLIIIPKKRNLLNRIFQHSHTKPMVIHSHVPVMAIH